MLFVLFILPLSAFPLPSLERILTLRPLLGAVLRMFQVHLLEKILFKGLGERLHMHVVAVTSSLAAAVNILLALGVKKVSHWGKNSANLLAVEKPSVHVLESVLGVFLIAVFDIHVAHYVITQVIHHDHILNLSVLTHLFEDFLEEGFKSIIDI